MSADIIELPAPPPRRSPRPPQPAMEQAIRLIELALSGLGKRTRAERSAHELLSMAKTELERGIAYDVEEATRDLGYNLVAALGPGVIVAEIAGMRRLLEMLGEVLAAIDQRRSPAPGGASPGEG